ncbi:Protein of unknown function [Bradyrhizobium sp. Rc2d]|uniref:DUF3551 domain-containing protein n=1 Tax=Bradyrhizobium sp. Rc2d TaxID=1855321 RepID=UPI000880D384|nr:DUF3551 domain-containing protein [Bradyrhizobium sp. Rc2d]SDJ62796.1 Protein of unknown function [Bradyrhizobium sp. Rc2d]
MRNTRLALLALGAGVLAGVVGTGSARADYDYPWCIQGAAYDYPGYCAYQTREQCLKSVSGRKGYCAENPRFHSGRSPQPPAPHSRYLSPSR